MQDVHERALMLETVEQLARTRIGPRAAAIDEADAFPRDVYDAMAEAGLFGAWVPEAYGGVTTDLRTNLLITERLARTSGACSLIFANCSDAVAPILRGGSEELKQRLLPDIASGQRIPCFALTEPDAGSDAAGVKARAVRENDGYRITGHKVFITNGSVGDVFVVFARTSDDARGLSAFIVERDAAGFEIGRDERMLGLRGCPATELTLDDVRVPVEARLGEQGDGLALALAALDESRLNASAMALGVARGALDIAVRYAKDRQQFGKPIIEHQGLGFLLAEMASDLNAAWAVLGQAIAMLETQRGRVAGTQCAMAKLFCTEAAMRVVTDAVQVLGGYGLAAEFAVERMMRDAKAFEIFDGTSQIQKLIVARHLDRAGVPVPESW